MKRFLLWIAAMSLLAGCSRRPSAEFLPSAKAYGTALVEVGGGKQVAAIGMRLEQPVQVQVNDAQGNGVAGAPVVVQGNNGIDFYPAAGLTDASGQFTTFVRLGAVSGRYQFLARSRTAAGAPLELKLEETALGYQEDYGRQLSEDYCVRCHDAESSALRVSNFDNLDPKPHAFADGAYLNKLSDSDLAAIIAHGGPALGKSAQMPPYADTLSKAELQAVESYIRAVADPPYRTAGVAYANH